MTIYERIKTLRLQNGLTLEQVGTFVGVSKATVLKWESGAIQNMRRDKIAKLAQILGTTPEILMGWGDSYPSPEVTDDFVTYPVLGEIAAGFENYAYENYDGEKINIPKSYLKGHKVEEFFVLKVKGESMFPEYRDGDIVLVYKCDTLQYSGQIGAVLYDGEFGSLKRVEYREGEDWIRLVPVNPSFPPRTLKGTELQDFHVLGIPKLMIRNIE